MSHRQGIPFFYAKSEKEFKDDPYENYDDMVIRQTALHLADELWNGYPMQPVLDFVLENSRWSDAADMVEIGGGVGRVIGTIAERNSAASCWAMDYSYQLLKRTKEFWMDQTTIQVDGGARGLSKKVIQGKHLQNLQVGLSKAEDLPFGDASLDLVIHSFLLDRLEDPMVGLHEMHRVLRPVGQMVMVSPLNFLQRKHWKEFYPVEKLMLCIQKAGFRISQFKQDLMIIEPLDIHGNVVVWKCVGLVCERGLADI